MTQNRVKTAPPPATFDLETGTLIVGAGACGLVAALSASEQGQDILVVEADPVASGSTSLSAGLIPAAGTFLQKAAGITDAPTLFAQDIQAKAHGENDQTLVDLLAGQAAKTVSWLCDSHDLPFSVVTDFDYPGHTRRRMHGLPSRSGRELIDALRSACERRSIDIIYNRRALTIYHEDDLICGVAVSRPDGGTETIACNRLILACNGFGGNRDLVRQNMPEIENALWFGHDGNKGEAVLWGYDLGADLSHLGAFQGHGNVAHPHGILITWAVITEGGFQVNCNGERFWNEAQGYSEAARAVLAQPSGVAYAIFDERIAAIARQFEDFKRAEDSGAIETADTVHSLAQRLSLPPHKLAQTFSEIPWGSTDRFGRIFGPSSLSAPFKGVRVTGALFHTQGGLRIDTTAKVLKRDGSAFPNLYAGGGAACGVSGKKDTGYLSGNGLLSAVVLGHLAGLGN